MARMKRAANPTFHETYIDVDGHEIFVRYDEPTTGLPTLVLLNGLADDLRSWDRFSANFLKSGYGILRLDFRGQGETLRKELERKSKFEEAVSVEDQSKILLAALKHFAIQGPVDLIGMSYGGGIALHFVTQNPGLARNLILLAPYVIRLDLAHPLQRTVWSQLAGVAKLAPSSWTKGLDFASQTYQNFLTHYMDHRFQQAVPDETIRNASIQLTFGIMKFNAFPVLERLGGTQVHLISGRSDTLIPRALFQEFWDKLPAGSRKSWLNIEDGQHLLLKQCPHYIASWVRRIIDGDPEFGMGHEFVGSSYSNEARRGLNETIQL